jgi:hypothetical protein
MIQNQEKNKNILPETMIEKFCDEYLISLNYICLFYVFSLLSLVYFEQDHRMIFNSLVNFLGVGLVGTIIQNYQEFPKQILVLQIFNILHQINLTFNIFLLYFMNSHFIFNLNNLINVLISLFYISKNCMLRDMTLNQELYKNNNINNRMNKVLSDVKKFTPEQKALLKQELINQMKEIINLKSEYEKKSE